MKLRFDDCYPHNFQGCARICRGHPLSYTFKSVIWAGPHLRTQLLAPLTSSMLHLQVATQHSNFCNAIKNIHNKRGNRDLKSDLKSTVMIYFFDCEGKCIIYNIIPQL